MVRTWGHVLTVGDLLTTLAVEATAQHQHYARAATGRAPLAQEEGRTLGPAGVDRLPLLS